MSNLWPFRLSIKIEMQRWETYDGEDGAYVTMKDYEAALTFKEEKATRSFFELAKDHIKTLREGYRRYHGEEQAG